MREAKIEAYLVERVRDCGGRCYKWVSPGNNGVPDRICVLPGGKVIFVELKAPGKTERADQRVAQARLRLLGATVYSTVDSKDKIDAILKKEMMSNG